MKRFIPYVIVLTGMLLFVSPAVEASTQSVSGEPVRVIHISPLREERVNDIVFTPDGGQLIAGASSGIYFLNVDTLEKDDFIPTGQWVRSLAISQDGGTLAAGLFDKTARTWNLPNIIPLQTFQEHEGWVRSVAFTPDGSSLITVADDDIVRIWDVGSGSLISSIEDLEGARVLAVSPDGETLAVGLQNKSIELRHLPDGELLRTLSGHADWVRSLDFSPDGKKLASGAFDATACIWNVADGILEHTLSGHQSSVLDVAFSPDGVTLATGSVDRTVRLWDVMTGQPVKVLVGHENFVYSVAYSPDGTLVASGAGDNTIRLWNVASMPDMSGEVGRTASDCRVCHHPMSTESHPAVVEVRCEACHPDGIGLNWCPYFPRSLSPVSNELPYSMAIFPQAGVPVPGENLSVTILTPANGEMLYTNYEYVSPVVLKGKVESLAIPVTEIEVVLEIWTEMGKVSTLKARPTESGTFTFRLGVNPDGFMFIENDPAAPLSCHACHDEYIVQSYLPNGDARLVVLATSPDGKQARDERWVVAETSRAAGVPVRVLDSSSKGRIEGLYIQAFSRLYEWRGRTATAISDADGYAVLNVEALSEASTRFEISVPSQVVNGVYYSGQESAYTLLEPGATSGVEVTLLVEAQVGRIDGRLEGDTGLVPSEIVIWAFGKPGGPSFKAVTKPDGSFSFTDLPILEYALFPDPGMVEAHQVTAQPQSIDLARSPSGNVVIDLAGPDGPVIEGTVTGEGSEWLPFAWLAGNHGRSFQADLKSGKWTVQNVRSDESVWIVSAPGYYSQKMSVDESRAEESSILLQRRPETVVLPWGSGWIFIPPETAATDLDGRVQFESGWLWGDNPGSGSVVLETYQFDIHVDGGRFALQRLPDGTAWFHLFDGGAEVRPTSGGNPLSLSPGEMVAISKGNDMQVTTYSSGIAQIIEGDGGVPVVPVWKPSLLEQIGILMARLGIGSAQIITFITYIITILSLVVLLLFLLKWLVEKKR